MNILISTIVWGRPYFDNFVSYSLPSLLSERNVPSAAVDHSVTILLLTEANFIEEFTQTEIYKNSCRFVHYDLRKLEDYGFNCTRIPAGFHARKYQFLSVCQNLTIQISLDYDLHIFNYADFIWADGAVTNLLSTFSQHDLFALLGFCMPVDEKKVKSKLLSYRVQDASIQLNAHQGVTLMLDNLHSEARGRFWNNKYISACPSYLCWEVPGEGVIIRAFHHTLLAVAPAKDNGIYYRGIQRGTLDGNFASEISKAGRTMIATDSESIFAFSMHTACVSTKSARKNKEEVLHSFAESTLTTQQLINFRTPILLKKSKSIDHKLWHDWIEKSLSDILPILSRKSYKTEHTEEKLQTLSSWKDSENVLSVHHFLSNWVMPRIVQGTKFTLKKWLGKI